MPRASFTRTSSSISATDKVKLNFKIENNKLEIDGVDLITSFREAEQVANEMELRVKIAMNMFLHGRFLVVVLLSLDILL